MSRYKGPKTQDIQSHLPMSHTQRSTKDPSSEKPLIKTSLSSQKGTHQQDQTPLGVLQRKWKHTIDSSPRNQESSVYQKMANSSPQVHKTTQLQSRANTYVDQQAQAIQRTENNTGLPDQLKTGIEHLSGYTMDDVKVHFNSSKPAQLHAHAYAQGTDIHLAPGQERHLPHEAWHVVQQKQGRVRPTMQLKGKVNVNDDTGLEQEADVMGRRANQNLKESYGQFTSITNEPFPFTQKSLIQNPVVQLNRKSVKPINVEEKYNYDEITDYIARVRSNANLYLKNLDSQEFSKKEKLNDQSSYFTIVNLLKELAEHSLLMATLKSNESTTNLMKGQNNNNAFQIWVDKALIIGEQIRDKLNESLWYNPSPLDKKKSDKDEEKYNNNNNNPKWEVIADNPVVFFNEKAALIKAKNIIDKTKKGIDPRKAATEEGCSLPTWYGNDLEIRLTQGKTQLRLMAENAGMGKLKFIKIFSFHASGKKLGNLNSILANGLDNSNDNNNNDKEELLKNWK